MTPTTGPRARKNSSPEHGMSEGPILDCTEMYNCNTIVVATPTRPRCPHGLRQHAPAAAPMLAGFPCGDATDPMRTPIRVPSPTAYTLQGTTLSSQQPSKNYTVSGQSP